MQHQRPRECICDGHGPGCPPCLAAVAVVMRRLHPDTLSIAMLRRRAPELSGREAALLVETTKYLERCYARRR